MVNILVVAFNRPDLTAKLINLLETMEPISLFFAADGPRQDYPMDNMLCKEVRDIIKQNKSNCRQYYLFRNENLGCDENIENSINWFFRNVDDGVILEDDCIPDLTFFRYAREILSIYGDNDEVGMVSGASFPTGIKSLNSYRFSSLVNVWGWATWKSRWSALWKNLDAWPELKVGGQMKVYGKRKEHQESLIDKQYLGNGRVTWGARWRLTCLKNGWKSIVPATNLIRNLGFNRIDSTSKTFYHPFATEPVIPLTFPLIHPAEFLVDISLDEAALDYYYDNVNIGEDK